jgi:hypothetical protein
MNPRPRPAQQSPRFLPRIAIDDAGRFLRDVGGQRRQRLAPKLRRSLGGQYVCRRAILAVLATTLTNGPKAVMAAGLMWLVSD